MHTHHYPPDLFGLMVDAIPVLCKSKRDVFNFLRGAGVRDACFDEAWKKYQADAKSVNKYEIAREAITKLNEGGDRDLAARRELLKRVVEFENFGTCWPQDQHKAKGLVSDIRQIANIRDSFTRMKQERDREAEKSRMAHEEETRKKQEWRSNLDGIKTRLYALFTNQNAQSRGLALERVLNDLFRLHSILVKENFRLRKTNINGTIEQIDGVVEFDGHMFLVEMKWYVEPLGVGEVSPHLVRMFSRGDASGIFISASGYTEPALEQIKVALVQKTVFCIDLQELVELVDIDGDLPEMLRKKRQEAVVSRNPFLRVRPKAR